jgi:hypothetical protein
MNYVRALDELGTTISGYYRNELGHEYDMRRVFATVIIGHPEHVTEAGPKGQRVDERVIQDAIRSYNAHLSRIEVRTYKDLVDSAERALIFENKSTLSESQQYVFSGQSEAQQQSPSDDEDPWSDDPPF